MGRKERVESALREELSTLIAREVKDPRVTAAGIVTIAKVECTSDLSVAKVWVSIYGGDDVAAKAVAGLQASAGFLRGPLGRRLNLQRPPELRFAVDVTAEMSRRLRSIVEDDEVRARAVGRDAGEAGPPPTRAEVEAETPGAAAAPVDEPSDGS